jgi:hypothetical protein
MGSEQLVSLKRDASNYLQAINCIPRTMRLMYDFARKQDLTLLKLHFEVLFTSSEMS